MKHTEEQPVLAPREAYAENAARARAPIKRIQDALRQDAKAADLGPRHVRDAWLVAQQLEDLADYLAPQNDPTAL